MTISVESRAHRILKSLVGYKACLSKDLVLNGTGICMYQSQPDSLIVITDLGMHVMYENSWSFLSYQDINEVKCPESKHDITGLEVVTNNKEIVWLPVSGVKNGKFYDAFEFLRFIMRVTEDLKRRN